MTNDARVAIHMMHRLGAVVTLLAIGWLSLRLLKGPLAPMRRLGAVMGGLLLLQIGLGLGNVLLSFPLWVAVSHNIVGALLLVSQVTLLYYLHTTREER